MILEDLDLILPDEKRKSTLIIISFFYQVCDLLQAFNTNFFLKFDYISFLYERIRLFQ